MPRLTDSEYVEKDGNVCPYCGSDATDGTARVNFEGREAFQDIECMSCGEKWTDTYELTGYVPYKYEEEL